MMFTIMILPIYFGVHIELVAKHRDHSDFALISYTKIYKLKMKTASVFLTSMICLHGFFGKYELARTDLHCIRCDVGSERVVWDFFDVDIYDTYFSINMSAYLISS